MFRHSEIGTQDPTANIDVHRPDDRFIPVRASEIARALAEDATRFGTSAEELSRVAELLRDVVAQEAICLQRELSDEYAAYNPDRDTVAPRDLEEMRSPAVYASLFGKLNYLLEKANFEKLSDVQIEAAIASARSLGLRVRVHADRVDLLSLWVRGRGSVPRTRRCWRHPFRGITEQIPTYRRLCVIARLKNDPHIVLKLFKEIPLENVEALLPHAEVVMTWYDRLLVLGGGAGAIGSTGMKIFSMAAKVIALTKLLWVVLFGALTFAIRGILGYRRARNERDLQRTRHLYFQNLANNAGVLQTLITMIMQEEWKEVALAYAFCQPPDANIRSDTDLEGRIETYIAEQFGVQANFDLRDALESLTRLGLWQEQASYRTLSPACAARKLEEHWRGRCSERYHEGAVARMASAASTADPRMSEAPGNADQVLNPLYDGS